MNHSIRAGLRVSFLIVLFAMLQVSAYKASPEIPGNLSRTETPQFITITFDDALHQPAYDHTEKILGSGHKNPNGAPIGVTYFISIEYTDFHIVQRRHAQGNEIAVHTMSHTTGKTTNYDTWRAEILGCKEALVKYAQIPAEDIVGFRAPFLAHADASFNVLADNGFLYETSVTEKIGNLSKSTASYIWPYTFEETNYQSYDVGEGPKQPYPNLWEIPMWSYYKTDGSQANSMDYPGGTAELLAMFKDAFNARYTGNRAPVGVFLHPGWLEDDAHAAALNQFLSWALAQENVWVVTNHQMIEWMKDPQPASAMNSWGPVQYTAPASGEEVPDGWDNDGDGHIDEGFVHTCDYSSKYVKTNYPDCPESYPEPVIVPTHQISVTMAGDTSVIVDPNAPTAWSSSVTYDKGNIVSYNDHKWECKWNNKNNQPGASEWGPWTDLGAYVNYEVTYNGTVTPLGKNRVVEGDDKVITISANPGYKIGSITVDGAAAPISNSYTFTNVTAAHAIHVTFDLDDGTIRHTVSATAGANGSIEPTGDLSIVEGTNQTFTVTPNAGYRIISLVLDGNDLGAISSYTLENVTANHSITATFEKIPVPTYTITATAAAHGTITPSGAITLDSASSQSYTIAANSGYKIDSIVINGANLGAVSSYNFASLEENSTINAYFSEQTAITYTITATINGNGTVAPSAPISVEEGTNQTVDFVADAGYEVEGVTVDGVSKGAITSYTFTSIVANHTIVVTFKEESVGGLCDNVATWDANQDWTTYAMGDKRLNGGKVWECINVAYAIYEPSGAWGYFGWKELGSCN